MRVSRFRAVVGTAAVALALGACGGSDNGGGGTAGGGGGGGKPDIAIVSRGVQHQFWQAVKEGGE